jgi:hypothetical protein
VRGRCGAANAIWQNVELNPVTAVNLIKEQKVGSDMQAMMCIHRCMHPVVCIDRRHRSKRRGASSRLRRGDAPWFFLTPTEHLGPTRIRRPRSVAVRRSRSRCAQRKDRRYPRPHTGFHRAWNSHGAQHSLAASPRAPLGDRLQSTVVRLSTSSTGRRILPRPIQRKCPNGAQANLHASHSIL